MMSTKSALAAVLLACATSLVLGDAGQAASLRIHTPMVGRTAAPVVFTPKVAAPVTGTPRIGTFTGGAAKMHGAPKIGETRLDDEPPRDQYRDGETNQSKRLANNNNTTSGSGGSGNGWGHRT